MQAAGGLRALARRVAVVPRSFSPTTQVRGMASDLRPREQKLLELDSALKEFKSNKTKIRLIQRFGDVLTGAVLAGCTYELYYRYTAREAALEEGGK